MRFLIVRLSSIGDIVHTLPAVAGLGHAFPEAEIDWVVEKRHSVLLEGNPYVRRVVRLDTLGWRKSDAPLGAFEKIVRGVAALREASYDVAIDFQGLYKSAIIAALTRSRQRLGFAEPWLREPAAGVFYSERVTPRGRRHIIEINLALVERLGARAPAPAQWEFPLPRTEQDDRYVEQQLALLGAQKFIVVGPGGGWQAKRWAPVNYAELIRRLERELGLTVLLTGSPDEEAMIQEILRNSGARRAGYFASTLVQLIALARRARLFIGGDTGPTHLAVAVGAPVVALFGTTDPLNTPGRNGPFRAGDVILSSGQPVTPSGNSRTNHYIEGVTVDAVLAAVRDRMARANG